MKTNSAHPAVLRATLALAAASLLLAAPLCSAGGISNVRVSQRSGTNLVDLHYDLATGGAYPMLVAVAVSTNGGLAYDLPATHFTGEVGYGVTAGTNKGIVWDAVRDMPDRFSTNVFFRLSASDKPPGMALIPAGNFTMGDTFNEGDSDEHPLHTVYVSAFYLDKTEVTKSMWDEVKTWATAHGYSFDNAGSGKASNHPVYSVNWYDMVKWCNARSEQEGRVAAYYTSVAQTTVYRTGQVGVQNDWVKWNAGYRMPTEAEWEKAARGGLSEQRFPWGNVINQNLANYNGYTAGYAYDLGPNGYNAIGSVGGTDPATSPVGSFAANGYGLYDMAGNVWERCWDWYGSYSSGAQTDPRGPSSGSYRVLRGGCWDSDAFGCRAARRGYGHPGNGGYCMGFRSALPPGQP